MSDDIMDDFLAAAMDDQEERFRRMIGKSDWMFRNVPPIPERLFPEFMEVIGQMNIHWIQKTQVKNGSAVITHGSAMFSPQAEINVLEWLAINR